MKTNCIIIEDEPLAQGKIKDYISRSPYLNLISIFENGIEALSFLKSNPIDLIFLDIHMDKFSGIQLLESAKIESEVILTTAYDEYALKGFDLNVTDYLLKPFTLERFNQSVNKAQNNLEKKRLISNKPFVFVKIEHRFEKIFLNEILYIEGMRDYRRIHTFGNRIMTLQTFKDFEQEIPQNIICRVHKSFMVSLDKIESVERDRIKIKDVLIPISETYKKNFFELISHSPK
jgi:two-component system, LytTR family, response regulator